MVSQAILGGKAAGALLNSSEAAGVGLGWSWLEGDALGLLEEHRTSSSRQDPCSAMGSADV